MWSGNDFFVFGYSTGYLYNDAKSASIGTSDHAFCTDYTLGSDKLQLVVSVSNYYIESQKVADLSSR